MTAVTKPTRKRYLQLDDGLPHVRAARVLRDRRVEMGMSQVKLAEEMGLSQPALCYYELGRNPYDLTTFMRWCDALGLNPSVVLAKVAKEDRN